MHRLQCARPLLFASQVAAFATAWLCWSTIAFAQPPASDPVEKLRRDLRDLRVSGAEASAVFAAQLAAEDQEFAKQLQAASSKPEERAKLENTAKQRVLTKDIQALRTISEMARALQLNDWSAEMEDDKQAVVPRLRIALADRFRQAIRNVLEHGSPTARQAVETLLAEAGTNIRTPDDVRGIGHALAPDLAEIVEHGKSREARETAARALGLVFPDPAVAVPALRTLLAAKDPAERRAAARGLLSLIEVVTRLISLTESQTGRAAGGATFDDVVSAVRLVAPAAGRGLKDSDIEVRRLSATALEQGTGTLMNRIPNPRGGEMEALTREKTNVPQLVQALTEVGPILTEALRDPDPQVRLQAQRALEHIGSARQRVLQLQGEPRGVPGATPLLDALRLSIPNLRADLAHPDASVRLGAVEVLETLGPAASPAIPELIRGLGDRNVFVRWATARTLGKIGSSGPEFATRGLARLLFDPDLDVRLAAATALQHYGPAASPAVPDLVRSLGASDAEMRMATLRTLDAIGPNAKNSIPAIAGTLADPDARVRLVAAEVLGKFGPLALGAEEPLRRALSDSNPDVRRVASESLLTILPPPGAK